MKALLARWYIRLLPFCLLLVAFAGCDEGDEHGGSDVIDVVYAIGDVVLAILDTIFQATGTT